MGDNMINYIWFFLVFCGILVGLLSGNGETISKAIINSSGSTVTFIIELTGIMCFWCGVMKVAENSGLTEKISKILKPILRLIFKEAAKDEKALGAIVMNLTANMMGLSNAATPFGIKAMEEMDRLNMDKETASNDMALF
jgi:spore maturation protein A